MMFDFFTRRTANDFVEEAKKTYIVPKLKTEPEGEHYRIGVTEDGMTTVTFMSTDGYSMTLSMSPAACERMIRMIRATYDVETTTEEA
jgi:hypothetical protein